MIHSLTPLAFPDAPVVQIKRPVATMARMAPALTYRAQARPNPRRRDEAMVQRHLRRFAPAFEGEDVTVQAVGRDGTVLLHRSYYGIYPISKQSIVRGRVETPVLAYGRPVYVAEYHDARNYAGSYYAPGDEPGAKPPRTEPFAFVRENGRTRLVGRGSVVAWIPNGAVATEVALGASGSPAFWEEESETHCHIRDGGRTYDLGQVRYVGQGSRGALVFSDADAPGVYVWRGKRLLPWARLPKGWTALATDGSGGLLARKGDSWSLAILRGRSLRPLRFGAMPPGIWMATDAVATFAPNRGFRIMAYQGRAAKPFELTFTPS